MKKGTLTIDQHSEIIHCTAYVMNKIKFLSDRWQRMSNGEKSSFKNYDEFTEVKVREAIQEWMEK